MIRTAEPNAAARAGVDIRRRRGAAGGVAAPAPAGHRSGRGIAEPDKGHGHMNAQNRPGNGMLKTGIAGTAIAAICCFTPVLVILFGAVGLSALVGYLDIVLFPALAGFIVLTLFALWRRFKRHAAMSGGNPS